MNGRPRLTMQYVCQRLVVWLVEEWRSESLRLKTLFCYILKWLNTLRLSFPSKHSNRFFCWWIISDTYKKHTVVNFSSGLWTHALEDVKQVCVNKRWIGVLNKQTMGVYCLSFSGEETHSLFSQGTLWSSKHVLLTYVSKNPCEIYLLIHVLHVTVVS